MQKIINKIIHLIIPRQKLWQLKNGRNIPSMEWSLLNIKKLGFEPNLAIDAGAFDGEWTAMFKTIFPSSKVLMIEGQSDKENILKEKANKLSGVEIHIGLLGAEKGKEVTFHVNATVSSVLEEYKGNSFKTEKRYMERLDDIVLAKYNGKFPDFIKLDVQGYELEVLKGSKKVLEEAQFILCEVSLIEINKDCPLIAEVINFMDIEGFVCYDICSFIRRPLDRALWQTDILFIRKNHNLIQSKHWN